jgi:hypothetical protein
MNIGGYMKSPYKGKEAQERFINHLKYLLGLHRNSRLKRQDWKLLTILLTQYGWKTKYRLSEKAKTQRKLANKAKYNKSV